VSFPTGSFRVVADTSSLVRAALNPKSAAGRLVDQLLMSVDRQLATSLPMLEELASVLTRPKFAERLSPTAISIFLLRLHATVLLVHPNHAVADCRDPADDKVLEAAWTASIGTVDQVIIVSDDIDLLSLDPWRGIRIMKPEAALEKF
jgi:putative PIN family toxin of toxin-antitoxin system